MTIFNTASRLLALGFIFSSAVTFNAVATEQIQPSETTTSYSKLLENNKNVFAQYGIDEDLPKLGLSSLTSGEHLVEHVTRTVSIGGQSRESRVFLIKDTDEKGNIDLRIKYNPHDLDEHDDTIDELERYTRTEYRLRDYAQSYDPNSVAVVKNNDDSITVSFNYSKYGLPQDIAYFRFMRVDIRVKNAIPESMVITNTRSFDFENYHVDSYRQTLTFDTQSHGKTILAKKMIEIAGHKNQKPLSLVSITEPVALYDEDNGVKVLNQQKLTEVSDPRIRETKIKLDRVFPLMGDMIRRKGIDLPLPYGVSVAYRNQDMNIPFNDFNINGIHLNELFAPEDSFGVVNAESLNVRGDVNILPFWNVFGYVGKINVDAQVDAGYTGAAGQSIKDLIDNKLPGFGLGDKFCQGLTVLCAPSRVNVPIHLEYDLRGFGTTLSIGYKEFFASVTGTVSQTRLKGLTEWGDSVVTIQPMIGYQLVDYRAQLILGAEYQGLEPRMSGHVKSGELEFDYDIGVDMNKWAYVVGFNKQIGKNYNLTFMYNKGETRNAMTLNLGYRF